MPHRIERSEWTAGPGSWTYAIAAARHPHVEHIWEVRGELSAFRETLLPNGFLDIMFNLGPPHTLIQGESVTLWRDAWLSGLQERALTIESLEGTRLIALRMTPLGAARLLGAIAPPVANRVVPLADVLGAERVAAIRAQLLEVGTQEIRFELLEQLAGDLDKPPLNVPGYVEAAVQRIDEHHGALLIAELHEDLGVSRKHLAAKFRQVIGIPAKRYAQLRRFLWTVGQLEAGGAVDWAALAHAAGYSDQSHMGRDFQRVGAAPPSDYVRRMSPDGSALFDS